MNSYITKQVSQIIKNCLIIRSAIQLLINIIMYVCVIDYPRLHCHTLEMHYILLTYNLRLNYVEMLESGCLALEFGIHGINM